VATYKNRYGRITFNKKTDSLTTMLMGFVPHHDFVDLLAHKYRLILECRPKKCLLDIQTISVFAAGSEEYLKNFWMPSIKKDGIEALAFLVSNDKFGKALRDKILDNTISNNVDFGILFFWEVNEANDWLKGKI
jgi:hypothetical protein